VAGAERAKGAERHSGWPLRTFGPGHSWGYRAARSAAGLLAGAGLAVGRGRYPDRLVVGIDSTVPEHEYGRWLVLSRLQEELGCTRLFAMTHVRRVNPNGKPTLQLCDARGVAVGFAKVGWSSATRDLVRNEAAALEALAAGVEGLVIPRVRGRGEWQDKWFLLTDPLPSRGRRPRRRSVPRTDALRRLSRTGQVWTGPLAASPYLATRRARLLGLGRDQPEVAHALLASLDAMAGNDVPLEFGRAHGDWTPWNLAEVGADIAAWDWEHSQAQAPWGYDFLHWHLQRRVPTTTLDEAVRATMREAAALPELGIPRAAVRLVVGLYLVDIFTRVTELAVGGGGWNPRFYPAMLDVAARWTENGDQLRGELA